MAQTTETPLHGGNWIVHPASVVVRDASTGLRASDTTQPLPTQAGSWRLEGLLGEGSFSRVFLARPARGAANRPAAYALKMLRPQYEQQPEFVALMRREATVGRAVVHPHLVAILASQVSDAPYFVVMPRLAGCTLAQRLAGRSPAERTPIALDRETNGRSLGRLAPPRISAWRREAEQLVRRADRACDVARSQFRSLVRRARLGGRSAAAGNGELFGAGTSRVGNASRLAKRHLQSRGDVVRNAHGSVAARCSRHHRASATATRAAAAPSAFAAPRRAAGTGGILLRQMLAKEPLRRPESIDEVIRRLVALEIETLPESVPV